MIDCVIVGGGAAGLAAARRLTDAGRSWRLFEARDRVGGRVHTIPDDAGHPVELGAEFVHGEAKETRELVELGGLTLLTTESSFLEERDGRFHVDDRWWNDVEEVATRARSSETDRSIDEFLSSLSDVSESARERARSFFESFDAADTSLLSEHSVSGDTGAASETKRVAEGYGSVMEVLRTQIAADCVRTSTRVTRVEWGDGRVSITTGGGAVTTARVLIVAVPLALLGAAGEIEWDPYPSILETLPDAVRPGQVARVTLAFREPFWFAPVHRTRFESGAGHLGFFTLESSAFSTWWSVDPRPHLVAWTGGPPSEALLSGTHAVGDLALRELSHVFPDLPPCTVHSFDWSSDPQARMAYSWIPKNGARTRRTFLEPLERSVIFCGEAFAPDGRIGTVDGALASGYRAADQAIHLLG